MKECMYILKQEIVKQRKEEMKTNECAAARF